MTHLDDIQVVPNPTENFLNERQLVDYRSTRKKCLKWLLSAGKNPEKYDGYATETVRARAYRMDYFYRWVWDEEDRYMTDVTHDHANAFLKELAYEDRTNADRANHLKALKMLFKWRHHQHGLDKWEPALSFYSNDESTQPRDYLTREERGLVRDAALEYGSVPDYNNLTPDARDRWRAYLAQRFEKPKADVTPDDWNRANGWKIPSLVATSLDAGFRPIEVKRAKTYWVDVPNELLRIPKEESSKNTEHWKVSISERTAEMLKRWLKQRPQYDQYQNTDALWLTREGNPYQAKSLRDVLHRLCDIAGIDTEHRSMSWYSIRHSVGTYMTREEGLGATQIQLRHKSKETTMKYDQAPPDDRRNALDRMG